MKKAISLNQGRFLIDQFPHFQTICRKISEKKLILRENNECCEEIPLKSKSYPPAPCSFADNVTAIIFELEKRCGCGWRNSWFLDEFHGIHGVLMWVTKSFSTTNPPPFFFFLRNQLLQRIGAHCQKWLCKNSASRSLDKVSHAI